MHLLLLGAPAIVAACGPDAAWNCDRGDERCHEGVFQVCDLDHADTTPNGTITEHTGRWVDRALVLSFPTQAPRIRIEVRQEGVCPDFLSNSDSVGISSWSGGGRRCPRNLTPKIRFRLVHSCARSSVESSARRLDRRSTRNTEGPSHLVLRLSLRSAISEHQRFLEGRSPRPRMPSRQSTGQAGPVCLGGCPLLMPEGGL